MLWEALDRAGWVGDEGMACQGYAGPLNGRAAAGYRLVKSERTPAEL
jgi:hypothetical protein